MTDYYSMQYEMITDMTEKIRAKKEAGTEAEQPIYSCDDREPDGKTTSAGAFLPVYVSDLTAASPSYTFSNSKCFDSVEFQFEKVNWETYNVHVKTGKKLDTLCREAYIFANTEIFHIEVFMFKADHTLTFKVPTSNGEADMNFGGIKVYQTCMGMVDDLKSAFNMAKLFIGGTSDRPNVPIFGSHVPPYMEKANVEFLKEAKG